MPEAVRHARRVVRDTGLDSLILFVTSTCNLRCGFCSFWEHPARREDELTVGDFATISGKLAEAGSMIVSIALSAVARSVTTIRPGKDASDGLICEAASPTNSACSPTWCATRRSRRPKSSGCVPRC